MFGGLLRWVGSHWQIQASTLWINADNQPCCVVIPSACICLYHRQTLTSDGKGSALVDRSAREPHGMLTARTIIGFLSCSVKCFPVIDGLVIFSFQCWEISWNAPLLIPCEGFWDVKRVERLFVSLQTAAVLTLNVQGRKHKLCKHSSQEPKTKHTANSNGQRSLLSEFYILAKQTQDK